MGTRMGVESKLRQGLALGAEDRVRVRVTVKVRARRQLIIRDRVTSGAIKSNATHSSSQLPPEPILDLQLPYRYPLCLVLILTLPYP